MMQLWRKSGLAACDGRWPTLSVLEKKFRRCRFQVRFPLFLLSIHFLSNRRPQNECNVFLALKIRRKFSAQGSRNSHVRVANHLLDAEALFALQNRFHDVVGFEIDNAEGLDHCRGSDAALLQTGSGKLKENYTHPGHIRERVFGNAEHRRF